MMTREPALDEIDADEDGGNGADGGHDADDDDADAEYEDEQDVVYARCAIAGVGGTGGDRYYLVVDQDGDEIEVTAEEFRFIDQYEAARRRQAEAQALAERRWKKPPPPPDPAETAPAETLTPRQEEFCRHYVLRPVAAHAAMLAGYGEETARNQGSRLLKNPRVLARIEALRAERGARHVLEAGTLHDKLESVFVDALTANHHAAAVAALRLQAGLARLPTRPTTPTEAASPARRAAAARSTAPKPDAARRPRRKDDKSRARRRKMTTKGDK